jgi:hypothetical protein
LLHSTRRQGATREGGKKNKDRCEGGGKKIKNEKKHSESRRKKGEKTTLHIFQPPIFVPCPSLGMSSHIASSPDGTAKPVRPPIPEFKVTLPPPPFKMPKMPKLVLSHPLLNIAATLEKLRDTAIDVEQTGDSAMISMHVAMAAYEAAGMQRLCQAVIEDLAGKATTGTSNLCVQLDLVREKQQELYALMEGIQKSIVEGDEQV